MVIKGSLNIVC